MEATVTLAKGPAVISLGGVKDSEYCCFGDRNIDVVVLHPNASDINRRINGSADPADGQVLPLDGLFSQSGEVFFKVQNLNTTHNLSVQVPLTYDHAPYMGQHDYLNKSSFVDGHPAQGGYITVRRAKALSFCACRSSFLISPHLSCYTIEKSATTLSYGHEPSFLCALLARTAA